MAVRSREYVGIAEGIKSHEISTKRRIENLNNTINELSSYRNSLEWEISSLEAQIDAARSQTDEEGNPDPDYGLIAQLESQKRQVESDLKKTEDDLDKAHGELREATDEFEQVMEEKERTLFEIQERARNTSANISKAGSMVGAYSGVGTNLQSAFQASFDSLSQAANILDGSVGGVGGGYGGRGSASGGRNNGGSGSSGYNDTSTSPLSAFMKNANGDGSYVPSPSDFHSEQSGRLTPATSNNFNYGNGNFISAKAVNYSSSQSENSYANSSFSCISTENFASNSIRFKSEQNSLNTEQSFVDKESNTLKNKISKAVKKIFTSKGNELFFNGIPIEKSEQFGGRYLIKGNHYDELMSYESNANKYIPMETTYTESVDPKSIEGITLNPSDVENPSIFWNQHQPPDVNGEECFKEIAALIPDVQFKLKQGISPQEIKSDSKLAKCYNAYFEEPIKVYKIDGFYKFVGDGRHRCIAAIEQGIENIPVEVIGEFYKKSDNISMEYALKNSNPNYSKDVDPSWHNNCQRCVITYDAIRKGLDVEALPWLGEKDYLQFNYHEKGWPTVYKSPILKPCTCVTGIESRKKVEEIMESWGENCRAIVFVAWKPENGGGGHVFIAERINGKTYFVDPQNGDKDVENYFELATGADTQCMRIDNREFFSISRCCKNRKD